MRMRVRRTAAMAQASASVGQFLVGLVVKGFMG